MKKSLSWILAFCLLFALSACGTPDNSETIPTIEIDAVETTTPDISTESTTSATASTPANEETTPEETPPPTDAPAIDDTNKDDPHYYLTVAEKLNSHFEKELIEVEHISDYFDGDNIRAAYNDWITLILAVDSSSGIVTQISFRAEPGDAPAGSAWVLVLFTLIDDVVDFAYPDIQIGSEVSNHYQKALRYNSKWNWPDYETADSYYSQNGIQCELYYAVNGLVFKVALP